MKPRDPLERLAHLTQPGAQPKLGLDMSDEDYAKHIEKGVEKGLDFVQKFMGGDDADLFEVQELVEAMAEQIRYDIRGSVTGDESDD